MVRIDYSLKFSSLLVKVDGKIIVFRVDQYKNQLKERFSYSFEDTMLDHSIIEHPSFPGHFLVISASENMNTFKVFEITDLGKI